MSDKTTDAIPIIDELRPVKVRVGNDSEDPIVENTMIIRISSFWDCATMEILNTDGESHVSVNIYFAADTPSISIVGFDLSTLLDIKIYNGELCIRENTIRPMKPE